MNPSNRNTACQYFLWGTGRCMLYVDKSYRGIAAKCMALIIAVIECESTSRSPGRKFIHHTSASATLEALDLLLLIVDQSCVRITSSIIHACRQHQMYLTCSCWLQTNNVSVVSCHSCAAHALRHYQKQSICSCWMQTYRMSELYRLLSTHFGNLAAANDWPVSVNRRQIPYCCQSGFIRHTTSAKSLLNAIDIFRITSDNTLSLVVTYLYMIPVSVLTQAAHLLASTTLKVLHSLLSENSHLFYKRSTRPSAFEKRDICSNLCYAASAANDAL